MKGSIRRATAMALGLSLTMAAAACGSTGDARDATTASTTTSPFTTSSSSGDGTTSTTATSTTRTTTAGEGFVLPQGADPVVLDPANFTTEIDNPYWPMVPGTRWTYREVDADGTVTEVTVIVTTLTKVIANGVTARVVRDTVTEDGTIIEDTIDWYAQDALGNVWYLGEDTAEFEDGEIVSTAGSFEAGVDGALPGIMIPANPQPGMRYRQEYSAGEAEDNGEVLSITESAAVAYGSFDDVLMTLDTTSLDPGVMEHKFYAPGVGPVLALDLGTGGREELISIDQVPESAGTGPLGTPNP